MGPSDVRASLLRQHCGMDDSVHQLARRSEVRTDGLIVFAILTAVVLCSSIGGYFLLRALRLRGRSPKYIPTKYLKRKWDAWIPNSEKGRFGSAFADRRSIQMSRSRSPSVGNARDTARGQGRNGYGRVGDAEEGGGAATAGAVDRNTSVRSIMTLPAYTPAARDTERILGREGERGGVDTVIEFPETAEQEESRRDEEMEELFRIRQARRDAAAARREERELRTATREAMARGDTAELEELRRRQQELEDQRTGSVVSLSGGRTADELIAEHAAHGVDRERGRRVSSVAYGLLGVARHDGSRVRSGSASSDHQPLLNSAASMGGSQEGAARARADSSSTQLVPGGAGQPAHHRHFSSSSLARVYTPDASDDDRSSLDAAEHRRLTAESALLDDTTAPPGYDDVSLADGPLSHSLDRTRHETEAPMGHDAQARPEDDRHELRRPPPRTPSGDAPPYEDALGDGGSSGLEPVTHVPSIEITPFSPVVDEPGRGEWGRGGGGR